MSEPPRNAQTPAYWIGALVLDRISLATAAMAVASQARRLGKLKLASR
jgi:hypothetical protein